MSWRIDGSAAMLLIMALFCTLPSFTAPSGDIRHHGGSKTRGWRAEVVAASTELATNNSMSNVTAQLGGTAFLHCLVGHLSERGQVSWVRKRDWHILSSGKFTYTNDERFQVLHGDGLEDWTLQIKFVQKRDNGTYECQVATGSGVVSHYVNLQIVIPEAFILGSGEHHVDMGSVIHLICIVEKSPTPPQYVFWYHNERMINYDSSRGGVTVETEPGARTQSRLTVRGATMKDSGNYTCSASNAEPASIQVFVSEGSNKMAAILRRNTSAVQSVASNLMCLLLFTCAMMHLGLR